MNDIEKIAMGFIGLAIIVALVAAKSNTSAVATSVFGGGSDLFASILSPVGGSKQ